MSRKSVLLAFAIVVFLVGGTTGALVWMVRHQPDFYRRAALPAGAVRKKHSVECQGLFYTNLWSGSQNDAEWGARFTEEQINSYFQEDFLRPGDPVRTLLPDRAGEPRVALEQDRIRVGLRYGHGKWSTIISADLRIWLVAKEPNLVALELERVRAGCLPIGTQPLVERITEAARGRDIEVTWYRHEGKPVALLHIQPGRKDPTVQLTQLKVQPGILTLGGEDRSRPSGAKGQACLKLSNASAKHR